MTSSRDGARLRVAWLALAVVLVAALAVGAARPSAPRTAAQRVAALEAGLRCPSCEDLSVAQSSAPAAVAIRQAVAARVTGGQSDDEIDSYLVSRYGPGILLRPPVHGGTGLVWLVPVVVVGAAIVAMVTFLWRRRRPLPSAVGEEDRLLVEEALGRERAR